MTLEDYAPRSMLVAKETSGLGAKFPFVDIHGHQNLSMSDADLARSWRRWTDGTPHDEQPERRIG